jgi:hypothetical protein
LKQWIKRHLSESTRRRARRLGRLRWITKARVAKRYGLPLGVAVRYVLVDPEVDSFTYLIDNIDELASLLARVLPGSRSEIWRYLAEVQHDPALKRALTQPFRRWVWSKRHLRPRGYHLICWAAIRAIKPDAVVETGILDGMASVVMLAALERNRGEGHEGDLFSFDVMPDTGVLVPEELRDHWRPTYEDGAIAIQRVLRGRRVGVLASDSLRDETQIKAEFDQVMAVRGPELFAVTTWGDLDVFGWSAAEVVRFQERPVGHFYRGVNHAFARL